jgi:hypothetical protein
MARAATDEQKAQLAVLDVKEQQALNKLKDEVRRAQRELGRAPEVMGAGRLWFDAEEERNNAYAEYMKDEPTPAPTRAELAQGLFQWQQGIKYFSSLTPAIRDGLISGGFVTESLTEARRLTDAGFTLLKERPIAEPSKALLDKLLQQGFNTSWKNINGAVPMTAPITDADLARLEAECETPLGPGCLAQWRDTFLAIIARIHAAESALREARRERDAALSWDDTEADEWSEAIDAAFPTRSGSHDEYGQAMAMVGVRQSKGALVALVNWLLVRLGQAGAHAVGVRPPPFECPIHGAGGCTPPVIDLGAHVAAKGGV